MFIRSIIDCLSFVGFAKLANVHKVEKDMEENIRWNGLKRRVIRMIKRCKYNCSWNFWNKGLGTFKRKTVLSFFRGCSLHRSCRGMFPADAGFLCDHAVFLGAAVSA
jgi:hypothetical protein